MSEERKSLPHTFEPTVAPTEVWQYLINATKSSAVALIWTKNQENLVHGKIYLPPRTNDFIYALMPSDESGQNFQEKVGKFPGTECFFNIPLPVGQLFFKTDFRSVELRKCRFVTPKVIYKIQRRKNVRFCIPPGHILKTSFQDPESEKVTEKKVFDISSGGLSFLTSSADETKYVSGTILRKMNFKVRLSFIQVEAKIVHVSNFPENPENTRLKIGVEFQYLAISDSQLIASYVLEESSKFLPRLG